MFESRYKNTGLVNSWFIQDFKMSIKPMDNQRISICNEFESEPNRDPVLQDQKVPSETPNRPLLLRFFPQTELASMGSSRWISLIGCGVSAFSVSDDLVSFSKTAVPFTSSIRHFPKCCCGGRQNANSKVRHLLFGMPNFKMLLWYTRGSKFRATSL